MGTRRLDHCNIRTLCFAETVRFYEDVLELQARPAPMLPPGSRPNWLHDAADNPVIHLTSVDPADPQGSYARLSRYRGADPLAAFQGSGAIDHIAFQCEGYEDMRGRLHDRGIAFVENAFPEAGLRQIFVRDPNGITLELNFTGS